MATRGAHRVQHSSHWGAFEVEVAGGRIVGTVPFAKDPAPSPIAPSLVDAVEHSTRIRRPFVRSGWLEGRKPDGGAGRGAEPFVALSWERALDLVRDELVRVRREHGNESIFGGSYGWASAGRLHQAPTLLHRFLNRFGGFTYSVNSYSNACGEVILPHVIGRGQRPSSWPAIAEHGELVVAFGGLALKNSQVQSGGCGEHTVEGGLRSARGAGVEFVCLTPLREDVADFLDAEILMPRPNTDVAIMLGLAHTLVAENLEDREFLLRYCVGFERFRRYLVGETDGHPKDASWAATISGLEPDQIRGLARRMASHRTLVTCSLSTQRQQHGEQSYWMAITLAAMLGQLGLPGGGFGWGYAAVNGVGNPNLRIRAPKLDAGRNPVKSFIPSSRISDLLLEPGRTIDYDGRKLTFPDIRLVYWCGGNPFHHHQDLNRLLRAWRRPDTVVVHEIWWTATARHADIVLPTTTTLERNDLGANVEDRFVIAMQQAIEPVGEARSDYAIFSALAERLGFGREYTEGRSEVSWLAHLYAQMTDEAASHGIRMPDFETFWERGYFEFPREPHPTVMLGPFRKNPEAHPLTTPSGKIEIFSETIASFGYGDCPGHPVWIEPAEWLGANDARRFPLHLTATQPKSRLHSQLDCGVGSRATKVSEREPILIHPDDAAARGIAEGDVVRVFNERGACLAGAVVSDRIRRQVVQLATGAWYDPAEPGRIGTLDVHGNPNVLTSDRPSSKLAQGPTAHTALVEIERFEGEPPKVRVFSPPPMVPIERR
jgi:biotin/methionine sulfoxide reductase